MKKCEVVSGVVCALAWALVMHAYGSMMPQEIFHMCDLRLPVNPVSLVPDIEDGEPSGAWRKAFVFSAQNQKDGKFDLHCKYMAAKDFFSRHRDMTDYAGYVVVTGCTRAVISQTPCYLEGLILNCARNQEESGQYCHCDMYLLKREGEKFKPLLFSELARSTAMFPFPVEESLFSTREKTSKSKCVSRVLLLRKDDKGGGLLPVWSILEAQVDLNSFSNVSQRVLMSYERRDSYGLSM